MPKRKQQKPFWPLILMVVGVVLIAGAVIFAANAPPSSTPSATPEPASFIPFPDVPRVSPQDARAAYETNAAVFLDVRGEPFYSGGHIPGAVSIYEGDLPTRIDELDPSDWIIPYCT